MNTYEYTKFYLSAFILDYLDRVTKQVLLPFADTCRKPNLEMVNMIYTYELGGDPFPVIDNGYRKG